MARRAWALSLVVLAGCPRSSPPPAGERSAAKATAPSASVLAAYRAPEVPAGATDCTEPDGPSCFRFPSPESAFRWVLAKEPRILAIGEAHAQRGTEAIASATKRFTESFLPLVTPVASDVVVELWAPDPKCAKEVKQVASAQKPVVVAQAETNQNEYVTLGTAAKTSGMTPWLLRPTCDDFSMLADAGDDAVGAMLGLVKRLTQAKVTQLYQRNLGSGAAPKSVIAYGGAMHNDLAPGETMKEYSFGPELDRLAGGRYVELDLIVPEYVKSSPVWEKLPWYAAFERARARGTLDTTTVYAVGERSFVLVFPPSAPVSPATNRDQ